MNDIKAVLATLVAAVFLVGCESSSLTPTDANVGCTPGQDQTCNDDPTAVTNRGVCLSAGTCQCTAPCVNPVTGRCLNPSCGCGALCLP
jgi:hypothetical protein